MSCAWENFRREFSDLFAGSRGSVEELVKLFGRFTTHFQTNNLSVEWAGKNRKSGELTFTATFKCDHHCKHGPIVFPKSWSEKLKVAANFINKQGTLYKNRELWCRNNEKSCISNKTCSCKSTKRKTSEKDKYTNLVYLKQCKICRTNGPISMPHPPFSIPQFLVGMVGTTGSSNTMAGREAVYSSKFSKDANDTLTSHFTTQHKTGGNSADNVQIEATLAEITRNHLSHLTLGEDVGAAFQASPAGQSQDADVNPLNIAVDNFILYRHGSSNYEVVRAHEMFYQWLFGVDNVMNKK